MTTVVEEGGMNRFPEDVRNNSYKKSFYKEEFRELKIVQEIIRKIPTIYKDMTLVEHNYEGLKVILTLYQEQPHLLDPHLESLLGELLGFVKDTKTPTEVVHLAFKYLYLLTKTRGFKVIVRLMPHEVADLEPVLALLTQQDCQDHQNWETRYMLLLWLSIVCMIPFDMVRLDSNIRTQTGENKLPIMQRIIDAGKVYLDVSDKSQDAAAYTLSKFMTRPDVKSEQLPQFLDWCLQVMENSDMETIPGATIVTGVLSTVCLLLKHGKREDLVSYAPTILKKAISLKLYHAHNTNLRKLGIKLVQRLGLAFLKARVASWRYQRGSRSLADNLVQTGPKTTGGALQGEEEDGYDIPEELEEVIEYLLMGLKDYNTIVRWSAAKGVGRITGRLPRELADDVVGSIMDLFTMAEPDASWHGGCLALAELGRRGLLLPQRLPDVVPVIGKALKYDEKKGNFSVGAHVRDAACYVCWAFARAYEPEDFKPYVSRIANALVITFIFDREVNIRRAAAAAFQENVGRQGQFPHGIDILTTCDYFAVGNRNNCYLELSMFVAQFPEYVEALIDNLTTVKTSHWDIEIRDLASTCLHKLTSKAPQYMVQTALPRLVEDCSDIDLNLRHGAIIAAAEVTHALSILATQQNMSVTEMIGEETATKLQNIPQTLHDAKQLRGLSGELMRRAVCRLIEKLSLSKMPIHDNSSVLDLWQEILDDCLQHIEPEIQAGAVKCIPAFFTEYYRNKDDTVIPERRDKVFTKYLGQLKSNIETTRMGYAQAIGAFPSFFIRGKLDVALSSLIQASVITEKEAKWTEARRDAVKAITNIIETVGLNAEGSTGDVICKDNIGIVYECLFSAMQDYTLDSRGDVGALVREATMMGLETLTSSAIKVDSSLLSEDVVHKVFCHLIQQSLEKIDRTRACSGKIFANLLYHEPEIPHVLHRKELQEHFTRSVVDEINWSVPSATFPKFIPLLSLPGYCYHVLLGLTVSVGGMTESLVKYSSSSLMVYLSTVSKDLPAMENFAKCLLAIFKDYQKQDRVTVAMFKMLDQLLSNGWFEIFVQQESQSFANELLAHTKLEIQRSGDPQKLLFSIDTLCGLLQFDQSIKKKTLLQLAIFLCHRYPIVRRTTANKLYEALLTYEGVVEEDNMDEVSTILSETLWDNPVAEIKPIRNQLCDLLGVAKPVAKSAAKTSGDAGK